MGLRLGDNTKAKYTINPSNAEWVKWCAAFLFYWTRVTSTNSELVTSFYDMDREKESYLLLFNIRYYHKFKPSLSFIYIFKTE